MAILKENCFAPEPGKWGQRAVLRSSSWDKRKPLGRVWQPQDTPPTSVSTILHPRGEGRACPAPQTHARTSSYRSPDFLQHRGFSIKMLSQSWWWPFWEEEEGWDEANTADCWGQQCDNRAPPPSWRPYRLRPLLTAAKPGSVPAPRAAALSERQRTEGRARGICLHPNREASAFVKNQHPPEKDQGAEGLK